MPAEKQRRIFNYQSGFGGIWQKGTPSEAPDNSATEFTNARFVAGGFQTVDGWKRIVRTKLVGRVRTLYDYQDGTTQHVMGTHNDEIVKWNGTVGSGGSWTVLKTGMSIEDVPTNLGYRFSMVTAFRRCYMQNGVDAGQIYDGSTVYDWGLPAPLTAPAVAASDGAFDFLNGEFENFYDDIYFFVPGDQNVGNLPNINRVPDNWTNLNRTKCLENVNAFSGLRSVQLYSGKEDGLFLTHGMVPANLKIDFQLGVKVQPMKVGAGDFFFPWFNYYHGRGYWAGKNLARGTVIQEIDSSGQGQTGPFVTLVNNGLTDSGGFVSQLNDGWQVYGGPFEGLLQVDLLNHPDFPIGVGGDMSLSIQVNTPLAAGEVEVEMAGNVSGATVASNVGSGAYEQLTVTHTFVAGDQAAAIYLRVKDQSPFPYQPVESYGLFDELRVVIGSTPPGPGGALSGTFKYKCVFVDDTVDGGDGTYSPIGPESEIVTVDAGVVELTAIPQPPGAASEHPSTKIFIYRAHSFDDGESFSLFNLVGKVAIGVTTFTDTLAQVDAETAELCKEDIITPPIGRWLVFHEGRMIVAGPLSAATSDEEQTISFTDPLNAGAFREKNKVKLPLRDNDGITGLAVNHDRLYAFTRDTVFQILFLGIDGEQRILPVSTGIGCYDGRTIATYESLIFFEGPAAIYAMNAQNNFTRISDDIKQAVQRDFDPVIDRSGVIYQNRYAIQGNIAQIYIYDIQEGGKWSFIANGQRWSHLGSVQEQSSLFPETENRQKLYLSDIEGYTYAVDPDFYGSGVVLADTTIEGNPTSGSIGGGQTVVNDTGATFLTDGDGLEQIDGEIVRKDSNGNRLNSQVFRIVANTATQLTLDAVLVDEDGNNIAPSVNDVYYVGSIPVKWTSKTHDFGNTAVDKLLLRLAAKVIDRGGDVDADVYTLGATFNGGRKVNGLIEITKDRWVSLRGKGRTINFRFKFSRPGARVQVKDIQAEYSVRSNRIRG